jgi:hypothetical protein
MTRDQRIASLLDDLRDCQADLNEATTLAEADCAREGINALRHSLWLAGYRFEEAA